MVVWPHTYTTLFEAQAKYNAIMHALGADVYLEMMKRASNRVIGRA